MGRIEIECPASVEAGGILKGVVRYYNVGGPKLTLFFRWKTAGKGSTNTEVVYEEPFDNEGEEQWHAFEIPVPERPWSYAGKLLSIVWELEVKAREAEDAVHEVLVTQPRNPQG